MAKGTEGEVIPAMRRFGLFALFFVFSVVASAAGPIAPEALSIAVAARVSKVTEFEFIRQQAMKMGVRVYLFGGTAAGFAHYVKWDLEREAGDERFHKDRFDYDYTNIYRTNQDLDIVVDGTEEQAERLESLIQSRFEYVQGGRRSKWEVRLLRGERNGKIALLDNPAFLNQHTDSNSTGMIELTAPNPAEAVRDLRDWGSRESQFLVDVSEGKIHYYDSDRHSETEYYQRGENPPIFSVLRFLTKVFQYDLQLRPEDEAIIRGRIKAFSPDRDLRTRRAWSIFDRLGAKMLQNPVNLEYAFETIERLGLKSKLMSAAHHGGEGSLYWWLHKAPLKSKPVGRGRGQTARELGIDVVAHETNSYTAWESITLAPTGSPNVLESRRSAGEFGETAYYGDGFYTRKGRNGARDTGLTIRFHVDPNAREGTDFIVASRDYVVMLNKAAFKVIPEGLNLGLVDYFDILSKGGEEERESERAIMEKLKRRMAKYGENEGLTSEELSRLDQMMKGSGRLRRAMTKSAGLLTEFFTLPVSRRYEKSLNGLLKHETTYADEILDIVESPVWSENREIATLGSKLLERHLSESEREIAVGDKMRIEILRARLAPTSERVDVFVEGMRSIIRFYHWRTGAFDTDFKTYWDFVEEFGMNERRSIVLAMVNDFKYLNRDEFEAFDAVVLSEGLSRLGLMGDREILEARLAQSARSETMLRWFAGLSPDMRARYLGLFVAPFRSVRNLSWTFRTSIMEMAVEMIDLQNESMESVVRWVVADEIPIDLVELSRRCDKGLRDRLLMELMKIGDSNAVRLAIDVQAQRSNSEFSRTIKKFLRDLGVANKGNQLSPRVEQAFEDLMDRAYSLARVERRSELLELGYLVSDVVVDLMIDRGEVFKPGPVDLVWLDRIFKRLERQKPSHSYVHLGFEEKIADLLLREEFRGHPEWLERLALLIGPTNPVVKRLVESDFWRFDPKLQTMTKVPWMPWRSSGSGFNRSIRRGATLGRVDLCRQVFSGVGR